MLNSELNFKNKNPDTEFFVSGFEVKKEKNFMWIMIQEKKAMVNTDECTTIYVTQSLGKKKGAIIAAPSLTTLGVYTDEKCALCELENLSEAIKAGEKFYQMP